MRRWLVSAVVVSRNGLLPMRRPGRKLDWVLRRSCSHLANTNVCESLLSMLDSTLYNGFIWSIQCKIKIYSTEFTWIYKYAFYKVTWDEISIECLAWVRCGTLRIINTYLHYIMFWLWRPKVWECRGFGTWWPSASGDGVGADGVAYFQKA